MSFLSFPFLALFLPVMLLIYWSLCHSTKMQNSVLFGGSLVFFYFAGGNTPVLLSCIVLSYLFGRIGSEEKKRTGKSILLWIGLLLNFSPLLLCRALDFLLQIKGKAYSWFSVLGIAFYTLQSSTYLIDLIKGKIDAEKDFVTYGLFVSFFPTVLSGPILKYREMQAVFHEKRKLSFEQMEQAAFRFLWGAFLKSVIADRLALITEQIFRMPEAYGGELLFWNMILYGLQLYTDFAGYSQMAIAVGAMMGIPIPHNFQRPYFAKTIQEFWHRWHQSLTSYLTENVYYPLGGNRKGETKRDANIICVFLASGIWHGAGWSFVCWGMIHAAYQILGRRSLTLRKKMKQKMKLQENSRLDHVFRCVILNLMVAAGWLFFRLPTPQAALRYILWMIMKRSPWELVDGTLLSVMSLADWMVLTVAIAVLFLGDIEAEHGKGVADITKQIPAFRVLLFACAVIFVLIFGIYGPAFPASSFIYAGF